jgi:hypothetical protein
MAVPIAGGSTFQTGTPHALFTPSVVPGRFGIGTFYDVAADGRFLVNAFVERVTPPATVVLNWSSDRAAR